MRFARFSAFAFAAFLLGFALSPVACFNPPQPLCQFRCGGGDAGLCPSGYTCHLGYCREDGTSGDCPFSMPDATMSDGSLVDASTD